MLPALLAALLLATALAPPAAAQEPSPWETLERLRAGLLEAGSTRAAFVQVYVPAGFSAGETERGTMYLALPRCMRWDYSDPYPKSFLLCGDRAWYWNPEDGAGRRYAVDREEEPGLDLLMLSVETLRERYRATARDLPTEGGAVQVVLEPLEVAGSLSEATLVVDPETGRLRRLSYRDREGNLTRFEIAEPRALDRRGVFEPPADVRWEDGGA